MRSNVNTLTDLIHLASGGDADATERLFAATYPELRKLARLRLRAGGRQTLLDTASLVHESYLRFAASGQLRLEDRVHFLRWAAKVMRSIIVDFARRRSAMRRGGDRIKITESFNDHLADDTRRNLGDVRLVEPVFYFRRQSLNGACRKGPLLAGTAETGEQLVA